VPAFGEHALWFEFTSDRFDHSSSLPEHANAGNRFYGRDVAELVATGLSERGFDTSFIDEDWGWQVHAAAGDSTVVEISIYHNPEGDRAREDDWSFMVRSLRAERTLGMFKRFRELPVEATSVAALEEVFAEIGVPLRAAPRSA